MKRLVSTFLTNRLIKSFPVRVSTSLSDNQSYPQVCLDATHDLRLFGQFRRHPVYNLILEHVTHEQGSEYLRLASQDAEVMARIDEFKQNDAWGNPRMHTYPGVGEVSPTTLRYVKVLADLKRLFTSLDGLDICEIGVGYGGQCRVVNAFFKPASYRLVDIEPALGLAQRFLDNFALPATIAYRTMNELETRPYDLVISNYAFTELRRSIQDVYLQRVILRSKRGYITYNEINPPEFRSYKARELVDMIPGAKILEEVPLTCPNNCIIVWGMTA